MGRGDDWYDENDEDIGELRNGESDLRLETDHLDKTSRSEL